MAGRCRVEGPVLSSGFQRHVGFIRWILGAVTRLHGATFPATSLQVNLGVVPNAHVDGCNAGPSLAVSWGSFSGGHLFYVDASGSGVWTVSAQLAAAGQLL